MLQLWVQYLNLKVWHLTQRHHIAAKDTIIWSITNVPFLHLHSQQLLITCEASADGDAFYMQCTKELLEPVI